MPPNSDIVILVALFGILAITSVNGNQNTEAEFRKKFDDCDLTLSKLRGEFESKKSEYETLTRKWKMTADELQKARESDSVEVLIGSFVILMTWTVLWSRKQIKEEKRILEEKLEKVKMEKTVKEDELLNAKIDLESSRKTVEALTSSLGLVIDKFVTANEHLCLDKQELLERIEDVQLCSEGIKVQGQITQNHLRSILKLHQFLQENNLLQMKEWTDRISMEKNEGDMLPGDSRTSIAKQLTNTGDNKDAITMDSTPSDDEGEDDTDVGNYEECFATTGNSGSQPQPITTKDLDSLDLLTTSATEDLEVTDLQEPCQSSASVDYLLKGGSQRQKDAASCSPEIGFAQEVMQEIGGLGQASADSLGNSFVVLPDKSFVGQAGWSIPSNPSVPK